MERLAKIIGQDDSKLNSKVMNKKLVFFLSLLCFLSSTGFATTYYNKSSGAAALQTLSNWGVNTDGSGSAPGSFTNPGDVFNLYNGSTATIR